MRFITSVLCVLGLCVACDTSNAQLLRGRFRPSCSSGSCANGTCQLPAIPQPAPVPVDPLNDGVRDQGGGKVAPKPPAVPAPEPMPVPPPPPLIGGQPIEEDEEPFFGVEWDKIANHKYDDKAHKITLIEAMEFAKGNYDDAKTNWRLVVIGTESQHTVVKAAMKEIPSDELEKISPWFVAADHWSLRDSDGSTLRFETGGKPTIYLMAPDGKVIHRQDEWTGQESIDAIRKGLKKYDPKTDPDLRNAASSPIFSIVTWRRIFKRLFPVALACGGAFFVMAFLLRRPT